MLFFLFFSSVKILHIEISNNILRIKKIKLFKIITNEYAINDITIIRSKERIGRVSHQLKLDFFYKEKIIAQLNSGFSGWEEKDLEEIYILGQ